MSVVLFVWSQPPPHISIPDDHLLSASHASCTVNACRPLRVAKRNLGFPSCSGPGASVGDTRAPAGCGSHPYLGTEHGSPSPSRPAASDGIFISIIVKAPIVQILSMVLSLSYMARDYPAPLLKNTAAHRSFPLRIVLLFLLTFLTILFYQVRNYSFVR